MTPTDAARWIINHYLPSGHPDKGLDFISLGGNECVFRHRDECAVTIARALLAAEETLTRAGWTKLDGAARWKPPINKDAYAPKFFEAEERIAELLKAIAFTVADLRHASHVGTLSDHDRGLVEYSIKRLEKVTSGESTGKAGG